MKMLRKGSPLFECVQDNNCQNFPWLVINSAVITLKVVIVIINYRFKALRCMNQMVVL